MTNEKISKAFTTGEIDALTGAVDTPGIQVTAFAVNLTLKERRALTKTGPGNYRIVEHAYKYAADFPHQVSPYIDRVEFKNDWELFNNVKDQVAGPEPLIEKLTVSYMAAGSEAFTYSHNFYDAAKTAAKTNTPGTGITALQLKRYYRESGGSSPTTKGRTETAPTGGQGVDDESSNAAC